MDEILNEILQLLKTTIVDDDPNNVRQDYYCCSIAVYNNFIEGLRDGQDTNKVIEDFKKNRVQGLLPKPSDTKYMTYTDVHKAIGEIFNQLKIIDIQKKILGWHEQIAIQEGTPIDENIILWLEE